MSSQYSIYSFRAEIQETGSPTEVTVSLTRSPAVANMKRDAPCRRKFRCHSKSKVTQGHSTLLS